MENREQHREEIVYIASVTRIGLAFQQLQFFLNIKNDCPVNDIAQKLSSLKSHIDDS